MGQNPPNKPINPYREMARSVLPSAMVTPQPPLTERIGSAIQGRGEELGTAMNEADMSTLGGRARLFGKSVSALAGGVKDVSGEVLKTAAGIMPDFIGRGLGLVAQDLGIPDAMHHVSTGYETWANQHPDAATALAAVGNLAGAAVNTYGVQGLAQTAGEVAKKAVKSVQTFPNLTREEISHLTPEERSLGMTGGSDSSPITRTQAEGMSLADYEKMAAREGIKSGAADTTLYPANYPASGLDRKFQVFADGKPTGKFFSNIKDASKYVGNESAGSDYTSLTIKQSVDPRGFPVGAPSLPPSSNPIANPTVIEGAKMLNITPQKLVQSVQSAGPRLDAIQSALDTATSGKFSKLMAQFATDENVPMDALHLDMTDSLRKIVFGEKTMR